MTDQTPVSPTTPNVDSLSWFPELAQEVREYLTTLHAAAGLPPPDIKDEELHAALQRTLRNTPLPAAHAQGLMAWLTGIPSHAVAHVQEIWSEWLQRTTATDQVLPMRMFNATHEMVGEGLQHLLGTVQHVASEKMVALENRYGRTGAILVFTAAVVLTPVPVPGTTFAPVLLAEGIRAVGYTFWSTGTHTGPAEGGPAPTTPS